MMRFSIALTIFAMFFSSALHAQTSQYLVVSRYFKSTSPVKGEGELYFYKSQVVLLKQFSKTLALVENESRHQAWIPRKYLLDTPGFHPISTWNGDSIFEVTSASADSVQTFRFKQNGMFRAEHDDSNDPIKRKWTGRLYRNGDIVWAKPKGNSKTFSNWSVFVQLEDKKLCMLNFDTELGCECVGSIHHENVSTVTKSCK